jgi:hypothetical protein
VAPPPAPPCPPGAAAADDEDEDDGGGGGTDEEEDAPAPAPAAGPLPPVSPIETSPLPDGAPPALPTLPAKSSFGSSDSPASQRGWWSEREGRGTGPPSQQLPHLRLRHSGEVRHRTMTRRPQNSTAPRGTHRGRAPPPPPRPAAAAARACADQCSTGSASACPGPAGRGCCLGRSP